MNTLVSGLPSELEESYDQELVGSYPFNEDEEIPLYYPTIDPPFIAPGGGVGGGPAQLGGSGGPPGSNSHDFPPFPPYPSPSGISQKILSEDYVNHHHYYNTVNSLQSTNAGNNNSILSNGLENGIYHNNNSNMNNNNNGRTMREIMNGDNGERRVGGGGGFTAVTTTSNSTTNSSNKSSSNTGGSGGGISGGGGGVPARNNNNMNILGGLENRDMGNDRGKVKEEIGGNDDNPELLISLYHKPRGTAGKYVPIENNEVIRVSPQAGKRLRIIVHSKSDLSQVNVSVQELYGNAFQDRGLQGIDILHQQIGVRQGALPNELQLDVKLNMRGKLRFLATDNYFRATSVQFLATNTPHKKNPKTSESSPPHNPSLRISNNQISDVTTCEESTNNGESFTINDIKNSEEVNENNNKRKRTEYCEETTIQIPKNLVVCGDVSARNFFKFSDIRLKTNIEDLVDAISIINSLSGKKYCWREGTLFNQQTGGQKVIGLIAQQVREVLPELVHENNDGLLSVNYADLVPVIISAFNEQTQEIRVFREEVRQELTNLKTLLVESQQLNGNIETNKKINQQLESFKLNLEKLKEKQIPIVIEQTPKKTLKIPLPTPNSPAFSTMLKFMTCFCIFLLIIFLVVGIVYFSERV